MKVMVSLVVAMSSNNPVIFGGSVKMCVHGWEGRWRWGEWEGDGGGGAEVGEMRGKG